MNCTTVKLHCVYNQHYDQAQNSRPRWWCYAEMPQLYDRKSQSINQCNSRLVRYNCCMTTYTIPAHHTTHTNLLKSTPFKPTLKEYNDGAVTTSLHVLSTLFQTSIRFANLKARQFTRLKFFQSFTECSWVFELHSVKKSENFKAFKPCMEQYIKTRYQPLGDGIPKNQHAVYLNVQHMSQNLNSKQTLKIYFGQIQFFQYHNYNEDSKLTNNTEGSGIPSGTPLRSVWKFVSTQRNNN